MTYPEYLQTPHWLALRSAALKRDGYRCRKCGATWPLHVHHIFYRKTGWHTSLLEDLETLCATCHKRHHETMSKKVPPPPVRPANPLKSRKQMEKERLWALNRRRPPGQQVSWTQMQKRKKKQRRKQKRKWRAPKGAGSSSWSRVVSDRNVVGRY